jgi:D-aminopeptidase
MEGVSQLEDWRAILAFDPAYWREGRAQMEAEVAAAARGLLSGGADDVIVFDNHASGNPVNVRPESLPAGARLETWHMFDLRERGVDALLQVGCHSRAELDAFVPHTYSPELVLHVDAEPISESHGRAWAADVPLLGICGNDVHARTLGSLDGVPYLVTQHTSSTVNARCAASLDEIEGFAEEAARAGGVPVKPPERARLEAFVRGEPLYAPGHPAMAGRPAADRRRDDGSGRTVPVLHHHVRPDKRGCDGCRSGRTTRPRGSQRVRGLAGESRRRLGMIAGTR